MTNGRLQNLNIDKILEGFVTAITITFTMYMRPSLGGHGRIITTKKRIQIQETN